MLSLSLPCTLLCRTIKSALVPQSGDVENPLRRLMCFKDETGKLLCIAMLVHQQQSKTGRKKSTWRLFCLPPEQVRKSLVPLKFPIIRFACVGFCFNQICGENPSRTVVKKWELLAQLSEDKVPAFQEVARKLAQNEFADMASAAKPHRGPILAPAKPLRK